MKLEDKKFKSFTISVKVLIPIFIFNLLIITSGWFFFRNHLQSTVEEQVKQHAEVIANSLDQMLWIEQGVSEHFSRIMASIGSEKNVEVASVIQLLPSEKILISSGAEGYLFESVEATQKFIEEYKNSHAISDAISNGTHIYGMFTNKVENDHDYIYILPTLIKNPETNVINSGVIYVQLQTTELVHYIEKNMGVVTIALLTLMLITALLNYIILQHYIFKPIYNIKKAIEDYYNGSPNSYVSDRDDEIGSVARALNSLFLKIKASNSEIIEKTNFLDTIVENIPLCFFAKDASDGYRWVVWNKKAETTFDLTKEDVLGKTDYDNFPKEEADFFRATDERVMREGKLVDISEEPVTTKRGTWPAHTIKVPVYDAEGNPKILIGMLEDISERKRQESALQTANENLYKEKTRLQTIMDSMLEGIITINAEGIIQHVNPGAEKMFGYSRYELEGKNINILMPLPDKKYHGEHLSHYKKTKEARIIGKNRRLIGVRKDGEAFPMALSVKNMVIKGETMFIGLARDITEQIARETELEAAKQQAESANILKSEFLSNMSHELRTPMHSIISFSRQGISHINDWDKERQESNLKLIKESGERLLLLINDLLDLSKL